MSSAKAFFRTLLSVLAMLAVTPLFGYALGYLMGWAGALVFGETIADCLNALIPSTTLTRWALPRLFGAFSAIFAALHQAAACTLTLTGVEVEEEDDDQLGGDAH